jgi:large subunit ribosomal protein L18e
VTASNPSKRRAAVLLDKAGKKQKAPIWENASMMLSGEAKTRVEVNIGRISRVAGDGGAVFVPGKVLGTGVIDRKVTVGAFAFSTGAKSKIEASGGSALTVEQFVKKFPKGSGVKLVR